MGSVMIGMIGAALAAFVGVGIQSIMATDGLNLPVMTIPFIVTTWLVMATKSKWLVATVADNVDLDDAMFLDRRHDGEEQAAMRQMLTLMKSPGQLAQFMKNYGSRSEEGDKYGSLDDEEINFENNSLLNADDEVDKYSTDEDEEEEAEIEMV
jgi:hypothetical protein